MQKCILTFFFLIITLSTTFAAPKKPKISSLDRAILRNDFTQVKKIIKKSRKLINPKRTKNGFPLYYAVYMDNVIIAKYLLKKGAKVNRRLPNGMTPLYLAVTRNQIPMTQLLVKYKANVNHSINKITPLKMAIEHKYFAITSILEKAGAKINPPKKVVRKRKSRKKRIKKK